MTVYILRNGKIVERDLDHHESPRWVTGVISDTMVPMRHHGTGRTLDSKSAFRADTKASGCIEIGDHIPKPRVPIQLDRGQRRDAIRQSLYRLRNGQA